MSEISTSIETERLVIRCYQPGDGAMYYKAGQKNQEHLARYESGNVILTLKNEEHAETIIQELITNWSSRACFFLGAFDKTNGGFIAQVYVGPVNWDTPEFRIGYFVDIDKEGKGYVTEAVNGVLGWLFNNLNAHRISIECDSTNLRSIRVAERCGFTREACLRANKKTVDGTFTDTLIFGLLKSDLIT